MKYDGREPDRQYGKNYYGRSSDSFRQSSRSSYGHSRNDKYADEHRYRERMSSHSGHESRDRDRQDEKRDHRRSFGDHGSDRARVKESYKNEHKELGTQNLPWEEKRKYCDTDIGKDKDQSTIKVEDQSTIKVEDQFNNKDRESSGKKTKLFAAVKDKNNEEHAHERRTLKFSHESKADSKASKTGGFDVGNDLDAAKVAAMKAAELVNKNLVGVGGLTTDQKKKILWGKKSITTEESGHRWDTALFTDRERQEKFNKLMSLRLCCCLWQIVGCERGSQSGAEFRQTKCRETEGTTPGGSRETVHCRPSAPRWPDSWIRSLSIHLEKFESTDICNLFE